MELSWEILYGVATVLLAAAIAWGVLKSKKRSRRMRNLSENATHEMYKHPKEYETHEREEFEQEAEHLKEKEGQKI